MHEPHGNQGSFWSTPAGNVIRWIGFIPVTFFCVYLVRLAAIFYFIWLFRNDVKGWEVMWSFFYGVAPMAPIFGVFGYFAVLVGCMTAPNPRIAAPILGTLLVVDHLLALANSLARQSSLAGITIPTVLILGIISVGALISAYADAAKQEPDPAKRF